jgi:PDZ domain
MLVFGATIDGTLHHKGEVSAMASFSQVSAIARLRNLGYVIFVGIALCLATAPLSQAQRGGMGAPVGGGHVAGGGHIGGGGRVGGGHAAAGGHLSGGAHVVGRAGGAHFVGGPHMTQTSARIHTTRYLTYFPHSPVRRSRFVNSTPAFSGSLPFSQPFFSGRRRFRDFRNGLFQSDWGFWPLWGWDSGFGFDCDSYESNCNGGQSAATGYPESRDDTQYEQPPEEDARPMIMVYLRDGSGYGALDYWLTNGTFYIETTYGAQKSFPVDQVDLKRTFAENTARGVTFAVTPYPSSSDPGPMFAPDSYAPDCPVPAQATQASANSASASTSAAISKSWFGASGSSSDRGLAVDAVRPNSPAAMIGVQPGDVIVRVNCQQVRTGQDVESAVNNTTGPIWVSYMIRGAWLTDKKIAR